MSEEEKNIREHGTPAREQRAEDEGESGLLTEDGDQLVTEDGNDDRQK